MTAPPATATVQYVPTTNRYRVIVRQPIPGHTPTQLHTALVHTEAEIIATLRAWRVNPRNAAVLPVAEGR